MQSIRMGAFLLAFMAATGEAVATPVAGTSPAAAQASVSGQAPLPPAGAAPIREAQGIGRPLLYWAAGGAVIITSVILLAQSDNGQSTTTTTTSTTSTH